MVVAVCQVVGVCEEELKMSQHWNGPGILNLMKTIPVYGQCNACCCNSINGGYEQKYRSMNKTHFNRLLLTSRRHEAAVKVGIFLKCRTNNFG